MLNYAERYEYLHDGRHVYDYISNKMADLESRKVRFEEMHRNGVFDVNADEARLLFYMLKYFIRRSQQDFQRQITFLLSIPRVTSILHQEVTQGQSNELLQLALRQRNHMAVEHLLHFPEVRRLAVENNYYDGSGIDVRQLVQNHESSMVALTSYEQAQLDLLENKYRGQIARLGGNHRVFLSLKEELHARYDANPAIIMVRGRPLRLPFSYAEFQRLPLSVAAKRDALKAYHEHPDHCASRFLSKPNLWIHPRAEYVEIDERYPHLRWAAFQPYIPMMCCFWLAASDGSAIGPEGYTVEQRKALFIKELAGFARAHNWDRTRSVIVAGPRLPHQLEPLYLLDSQGLIVSEEFDDGEPDKPTCSIGLNRRIFQSLRDHPLFSPLTIEHIDEEIRGMVTDYFKQVFKTCPHLKAIKDNIHAFIMMEVEQLSEEVVALNISTAEVDEFIRVLHARHGGKFTANIGFEQHIRSTFALHVVSASHIANFYESYNVGQLLEEEISRQERPRSAGVPEGGPIFFTTAEEGGGAVGQAAALRSITRRASFHQDTDEEMVPTVRSPRRVSFFQGTDAQACALAGQNPHPECFTFPSGEGEARMVPSSSDPLEGVVFFSV